MIKTKIQNGKGDGKSLSLIEKRNNVGVVAYSDSLYKKHHEIELFHDDSGHELNRNLSGVAADILIHDGGDNQGWAGSNLSGNRVSYSSTRRSRTGTKSIYFNRMNIGDRASFSSFQSYAINDFTGIEMYINIDKNWEGGDMFAMEIGTMSFPLESYIDISIRDAWQKIEIPFPELNNARFDLIVIECLDVDGDPLFHIDDINLIPKQPETGGKFYIDRPLTKQPFILNSLSIIVSAINLEYDDFFGVGLDYGISIAIRDSNSNVFNLNAKDIADLLSCGFVQASRIGDLFKITLGFGDDGFVFENELTDFIEVYLQDDFSLLEVFRISAELKVFNIE